MWIIIFERNTYLFAVAICGGLILTLNPLAPRRLEWYYGSVMLRLILTHWGWVTYICIGKLTIIGSDNGLLPGQHQAIIWTNAWILLIETLRTNFNEILIKFIHFHSRISIWKCRLENGVYFGSASMCYCLMAIFLVNLLSDVCQ